MEYRYAISMESDLEIIKKSLEEILSEIELVLKNEDLLFDIRLILNELVINSAIHGNGLGSEKLIDLEIFLTENSIEIMVKDEGEGINIEKGYYNPKELKCCGRGLFIVDSLSDQLIIEHNRVSVIKRFL